MCLDLNSNCTMIHQLHDASWIPLLFQSHREWDLPILTEQFQWEDIFQFLWCHSAEVQLCWDKSQSWTMPREQGQQQVPRKTQSLKTNYWVNFGNPINKCYGTDVVYRTSSVPSFVLHYFSNKDLYFSLEFCLYPILIPNKETERQRKVKQFIFLVLVSLLFQYEILEKLVT